MANASQPTFERWLRLLRISIAVIYVWFGMLKFFPGVSPAEDLAKETIHLLTFGLISPELSLLLLAIWEVAIGIILIAGVIQRMAIPLVLIHLICTFTPLILLPSLSFTSTPFALTLIGQYIIKNLIIVSALLTINAYPKKLKSIF